MGNRKKEIPRANNFVHLEYKDKKPHQSILGQNIPDFQLLYDGGPAKQLLFGDNLHALRYLLSVKQMQGCITLVYIDPPFSTESSFVSRNQKDAYADTLTGAVFVEFLRERLILLHELLSESGSIYLHLDAKMIFEMKIIMDEIFGPANFRNMIVRKKCNPKNYTRNAYGNIADFILFYTKSSKYIWNRPVESLSPESMKEYHYVEAGSGRRFMKVPIHAPGKRKGETGKPWRGMMPPRGKHWQYLPKTLDEMDARGEIFWSKNGNPRRKVYLDQHPGVGVQDIWLDFKDAHNQNIKITGYPTEKNPDLLKRIITASSNPGDIVLDCFAGSGTTPAVADKLKRHWIAVDKSPEAFKTILKRLEQGLQPMGDYVKKKQSDEQLKLFSGLEEGDVFGGSGNFLKHEPTTDISIYSFADHFKTIEKFLKEWLTRNNIA